MLRAIESYATSKDDDDYDVGDVCDDTSRLRWRLFEYHSHHHYHYRYYYHYGDGHLYSTPHNGVSLGLDASDLSFAAATAAAATPPAQQVLVYFDNYQNNLVGDVYLQLTLSGAAVVNSVSTVGKISIDASGNITSSGAIITNQTNDLVNVGRQQTVSLGRGKTLTLTLPMYVRRSTGGASSISPASVGMAIRIPAVAPTALGAGKFSGTATVRACLGDSSCATGELPGSPRTINISYVVDPVASGTLEKPTDAVVPRIQVANNAGNVVIRGQSLSGVTNERFGSTAATAITVVSDTEVRAQVPAMPAGQLEAGGVPAALVATDNGSHIFVTQSVTGGAVLDYDTSNSVVGAKSLSIRHVDDQPLAVDQNVTRVIPYDGLPDTAQVRDGNFAPLATLKTDEPGVFSVDAVVVNRAGTRAVALRNNGNFYFFDLTAAPAANGNAVQTDAPLVLNFSGGGAIQTAITADGQVAFFAGKNGVAVVPIMN